MGDVYNAFLDPLEMLYIPFVVRLQGQLLLVEQTVLSPSMILAGGLLCQDGWAAPSMRFDMSLLILLPAAEINGGATCGPKWAMSPPSSMLAYAYLFA